MPNDSIEVVRTDLEIKENIRLHKKGWKFQRIGWYFIFAIVALAALGLFGSGVLSNTTDHADNFNIKYDRFYRKEAKMKLKLDILKSDGPTIDVAFPNQYLDNFKIESILPEPKEAKVSEGMVHYIFSHEGPSQLTFYVVPQNAGSIQGKVSIDGNEVPITHFIYP